MFITENLVIMPAFFGPYERFLCAIVNVMVATVPVAVQPSDKICTNLLLLCLCFMCNYEHSEHHILCEPLVVIVFFLISVYAVWVGQLNNMKNSHSPTEIQRKRAARHNTLAPDCSPKHGNEKTNKP